MILVLDNLQNDDTSWTERHHSDLDRRNHCERHRDSVRRADLSANECRRNHAPSQRTLARLGFANGLCRPNYSAQRLRLIPNAHGDDTSSDWQPL